MASLDRPLRLLPSCTILNNVLALSAIVRGRLIRSHIPAIVLNALINVRSELLIVLRFVYNAFPDSSKDAAPVPGPIIVERSLLPNKEFSGPPTRDLSSPPLSLEKVRHSDPTSITRSPTT